MVYLYKILDAPYLLSAVFLALFLLTYKEKEYRIIAATWIVLVSAATLWLMYSISFGGMGGYVLVEVLSFIVQLVGPQAHISWLIKARGEVDARKYNPVQVAALLFFVVLYCIVFFGRF